MEKQANKLYPKTMFKKGIQLLSIFILLNSSSLFAQDTKLESGKEYILAKIDVTGKISYNEQTVTTFTGLEKGQQIIVPGQDISNAIKKLWKLGLFSDVNFYVNKIEGDSIFLELNINELPKLSDVKIQGVKKGKTEELIKETDLKKGKIVNENLITTTKNYIENKYKKDGYYQAKVVINTIPDSLDTEVKMVVNIDKGDKVKALAVTSKNRFGGAPELLTIQETGVKGYEHTLWQGVFVPAGTTKEIINTLNNTILKMLETPDLKERLVKAGVQIAPLNAQQFSELYNSDIARWKIVIEKVKIKLD